MTRFRCHIINYWENNMEIYSKILYPWNGFQQLSFIILQSF